MNFVERLIDRFMPKQPGVIKEMPPHVSELQLDPRLLGLHLSHTDKPDKATVAGMLPKNPATVPKL